MEQLNRVELRGTVGAIRRTTVQGRVLGQMSLATNYAYKDAEGCAVIETTWHNVHLWEGRGITKEVIESLDKGDKVYLMGRIRMQRYTGEDGTERTVCEIIASSLDRIDSSENLQLEM